MTKLTELKIEEFAIELLKEQGYEHIDAPNASDSNNGSFRNSFDDVLLEKKLRSAILRINPNIDAKTQDEVLSIVKRVDSSEVISGNESFHSMMTNGVNVIMRKDDEDRGDYIKLIDFDNPDNNEFTVVNQFTVTYNNQRKRPDVILFVNGIPLVVLELKNSANENATIASAYNQLQTYIKTIPSLFIYNSILIISDGLDAKAGSVSSELSRFMSWKSSDGKVEDSSNIPQLYTLIKGMLNKSTLLDVIRNFIVFERSKTIDSKTGITTIQSIKKITAYHQYYAVNKAITSVITASCNDGDRKGGVIWHTQGSGKSLTMVFAVGKIVKALNNPTILIITDRNDLDDQLFDTFASSEQLLRQIPNQAESREKLKKLLKVASGGVVFTTIQKFQPSEGNIYEELSNRKNIVVIADEAHRTQYGFGAKTIDDKDADGNVIGKRVVYGFAKYMRDALPNATYLGFTGTPIEKKDINTPAVFGNYIDIYDIARSVEDGTTVRIFYESRLAKITLSEEGRKLIAELDKDLSNQELSNSEKVKTKLTQLEALVGSKERVANVAEDIVRHFDQRQSVFEGKAMVVAMSRRVAVMLYDAIISLKPEWHNDDLDKGVIKVVMTSASSDGFEISKHHTTKEQRRILANRMKNPSDELKLVIVRDMWLTGFDVPSMHTLYIDKPMQGHNLMQAIARVNRVYKDKPGGLIVDYLGIASDLKKALSFYSDNGGRGSPATPQEQAVDMMLEKMEVISSMLHGFNYSKYFDASTKEKLSIILDAEEYILGLEDGKKRFVREVTKLSLFYSIVITHESAVKVRDEVAFFQAIKARLVKFSSLESGEASEATETAIRQVIDKALVSSQVIDVFDAAGIKKPDISILSEDFLAEIRNMGHKNIALETMKKLLNDEIKTRTKKNLVQSKSLMNMLEDSIKRYHNKTITATEVIEEVIKIAKDIEKMDQSSKELKLTEYEYAFYSAVADNESARELMEKDKLRELAVNLTEQVKRNASIDWTKKESVKAKLRVSIRKTLRKFKYPPNMEKLAIDNTIKQAELIAEEITR
jgi:type I restriction enzyme, R subunit